MDHSMSDSEHQRRRTERARKGGRSLLERYGREHFAAMGRRGIDTHFMPHGHMSLYVLS